MADKAVKIILGFQANGADQARAAARGVTREVEDLAKKLRSADFSVVGDLEKRLRGADFGATSRGIADLGREAAMTRQQALALTYTINDVVASLASGSSIFTIAAQQGGQLTQAFGGVRQTFAALLPTLARVAPIAGVAGAALAAFGVVNFARGVAQQAADLQKAADEAGIAVGTFQKIKGAAGALGLDADGVAGAVANIGKAMTETGDKAGGLAEQIVLSTSIMRAGATSWDEKKLSIRAYGLELEGVEKIAAALGVPLRDASGAMRDPVASTMDLARALTQINNPALRARAAFALFGNDASSLLPAIRDGGAALDQLEAKFRGFDPEFDPQALAQARAFNVALADLNTTFAKQFGFKDLNTAALTAGIKVIEYAKAAVLDVSQAFEILREEVGKPIWDGLSSSFEALTSGAEKAFASVKQSAATTWADIREGATRLIGELSALDFGGVFSGAWETLKAGATEAYAFVADKINDLIGLAARAGRALANALGIQTPQGAATQAKEKAPASRQAAPRQQGAPVQVPQNLVKGGALQVRDIGAGAPARPGLSQDAATRKAMDVARGLGQVNDDGSLTDYFKPIFDRYVQNLTAPDPAREPPRLYSAPQPSGPNFDKPAAPAGLSTGVEEAAPKITILGQAAQQASAPLAVIAQSAQQAGSGLSSITAAVQQASGALQQLPTALSAAPQAIQSAGESIASALSSVAQAIQQAAASIAAPGGGATVAAATGGHIRGPGTGTSDSILARLSNGEFVIRAAAVSKFGPGLFHSLNNLRMPAYAAGGPVGLRMAPLAFDLPRYADGGLASAAVAAGPSERVVMRGDIVIGGERFGPFSAAPDAFDAIERRARQRRMTRLTK